MPDPNADRIKRSNKMTEREGWVKVPRDIEWQEDAAEEIQHGDQDQQAAASNTILKPTSVVSLFREFFLKAVNANPTGVKRRAGGPGAGTSDR